MTLKERKLYKSGKRNINGYRFNPFDYFNNRNRAKIVCAVLAVCLIFEFLCIVGVTSWTELLDFIGIVDCVRKQDSDFAVYYLDAGQGDCTVVICDDEVMMIDTGTLNQSYNIRNSLYMLGVDNIDYLLITHQHDDHIGSASEIINHYSVSDILMPKLSDENNVDSLAYYDLFKSIAGKKINSKAVSCGDSFMLGSALVEIFAPMRQDKNINNMSVVLKITYGNTTFLFTGDSEKEVEKRLLREGIDISADVLSVGHHGSKTSSTDNFLSAVNPQYAVISCGKDNNFGHPSSDTLLKFEEMNILPYITSVNGDIVITSDGDNVTVIPQKTGF